jgi:hypothetical protein
MRGPERRGSLDWPLTERIARNYLCPSSRAASRKPHAACSHHLFEGRSHTSHKKGHDASGRRHACADWTLRTFPNVHVEVGYPPATFPLKAMGCVDKHRILCTRKRTTFNVSPQSSIVHPRLSRAAFFHVHTTSHGLR